MIFARVKDFKFYKFHKITKIQIFTKNHKICDIKNFFGENFVIFGENLDFGDFVKFVKFEILNPSENQNLKSLTLAHQIWI